MSSKLSYRADIDGLRAVSVMSVVMFHASPSSLRGGFVGVDIFFVISGFLITRIIQSQLTENRFSIAEFYGRRIKRIFPALALVLAASLAFGWTILLPSEFAQLGKHTAGGAGFISNLIYMGELGYFDTSAELKPLLHLWSLGVEEQYYIIWPLFCMLLFRMGLPANRYIVVFFAVSLAFGITLTFLHTEVAFYLPVSRFWELAVGSILAGLLPRDTNSSLFRTARTANWFSVAGLILIVLSFVITRKNYFPGFWPLMPTFGAVILIAAGPNAWVNRNLLSLRPLVFVGLISYPLYLWHWPLLAFVRIAENTFREAPAVNRFAAVALSFILAWMTWRLVERPLRFGLRSKDKIAGLVAAVAGIGLAGSIVFWQNGIPSRLQLIPAGAVSIVSEYPHPLKNDTCAKVYPEFSKSWSCLLSQPRPAEILIVGDSHAHQYYRSLADALESQSVLNLSSPTCFPFVSKSWMTRRCDMNTEALLTLIKTSKTIKSVYLTGYFSVLAAGGFKYGNIEGQRLAADLSPAARQSFQENAAGFLKTLLDADMRVTVIGDIPDLVFTPVNCVRTSNAALNLWRFSAKQDGLSPEKCALDEGEFRRRNKPYDDALKEVLERFPTVSFFDPRPQLCDGNLCWAIKDGVALYWNSDHLTYEGTQRVIRGLISQRTGVGFQ